MDTKKLNILMNESPKKRFQNGKHLRLSISHLTKFGLYGIKKSDSVNQAEKQPGKKS